MGMSKMLIRTAERGDLARITEIYNDYVPNTPGAFDVEAYTVERREAWFAQFSVTGRHRLLVAEENVMVVGYAGTTRVRPKQRTRQQWRRRFIVRRRRRGRYWEAHVYGVVEVLRGEDIHRFVAGYALPNAATEALHRRFGFKVVGVFGENGRKFGKYWDVCWVKRAG